MNSHQPGACGFTLVEIIVTLTVSSLLAMLLLQFIGTSVSRSAQPLNAFQEEMMLQSLMESMNADYKHLLLTDMSPLPTFKARVEGNHYGVYTVLASDYIAFDATTHVEIPCDVTATDCRLLKIEVASGGQSLTALFAR
jgi:prepilin-type N-terminal cleavage/methylation domain-containing protein